MEGARGTGAHRVMTRKVPTPHGQELSRKAPISHGAPDSAFSAPDTRMPLTAPSRQRRQRELEGSCRLRQTGRSARLWTLHGSKAAWARSGLLALICVQLGEELSLNTSRTRQVTTPTTDMHRRGHQACRQLRLSEYDEFSF